MKREEKARGGEREDKILTECSEEDPGPVRKGNKENSLQTKSDRPLAKQPSLF